MSGKSPRRSLITMIVIARVAETAPKKAPKRAKRECPFSTQSQKLEEPLAMAPMNPVGTGYSYGRVRGFFIWLV